MPRGGRARGGSGAAYLLANFLLLVGARFSGSQFSHLCLPDRLVPGRLRASPPDPAVSQQRSPRPQARPGPGRISHNGQPGTYFLSGNGQQVVRSTRGRPASGLQASAGCPGPDDCQRYVLFRAGRAERRPARQPPCPEPGLGRISGRSAGPGKRTA
ncbi:uncharacterized protein A4U43_C04F600 [Asparagus officinalis]|uniref:Uncharacterized protein n=1 Tax=Asparagus officinalis TaxID=4686 RepID=A0A5P1EX53_ASPOF|nr:uncharacterized protein A4U43_C04F600 [Asparagus officinalis]